MNPRLVLLYTDDRNFDRVLTEALFGTGAIILIARRVRDALQIVLRRGRELDLVVLELNNGCHGMTLLSAVNTCYERLPILATTSDDATHAAPIAYANGARACLNKPVPPAELAAAIEGIAASDVRMVAA